MTNEKVICEKCGYEASKDDLFCSFCGRNLKASTKAIKDVPPPEDLDLSTITAKSDLLNTYKQITSQLERFEGFDDKFYQQRDYYNSLVDEINKARVFYEQRRYQTDKELKDVRDLQKLSWKSIKARIKGDREDLLKQEEVEHLAALNREEAAKMDLDELNKRLKNAQDQLNELTQLNERKKKLEQQLVKVVDTACEGVADPIEDKIELELKNLYSQRAPLSVQLNRYKTALGHLHNAKTHFERALESLGSAKGYSDWDTFFGGGLIVDSIKHSRIADARNSVQQAQRSAERAYTLLPNMPILTNRNDDFKVKILNPSSSGRFYPTTNFSAKASALRTCKSSGFPT